MAEEVDYYGIKNKRRRTPNYTTEERQLFLSILKPYKHIIFSTKNTSAVINAKASAWKTITKEYNMQNPEVPRNRASLKALLKTIRRQMRAQKEKKEGGSANDSNDSMEFDSDIVNIKKEKDDDQGQNGSFDAGSASDDDNDEIPESGNETRRKAPPVKYYQQNKNQKSFVRAPIYNANNYTKTVLAKYGQYLDTKIELINSELTELKEDIRLRRQREQEEFELKKKRDHQLFMLQLQRRKERHELNLLNMKLDLHMKRNDRCTTDGYN